MAGMRQANWSYVSMFESTVSSSNIPLAEADSIVKPHWFILIKIQQSHMAKERLSVIL